MPLSTGAKVMVCHRRLFPEDYVRFFFGSVEAYADGVAKVSGFTWTRDPTHGFQRKADRRTKLVPVASGSVIVYEIPSEVDVEAVQIEQVAAHTVAATGGRKIPMDLAQRL